jgi:hypothetical protein
LETLQEEVDDYLDSTNPGMKELLQEIDKESEVVDEKWRKERIGNYDEKVIGDKAPVWRALKKLTEGEARKVVMAVKSEDGFRARQKLRQRFDPSLASKQGMVIAEFSGMVARPAKTPSEIVNLLIEMERKMKNIEDITGEEISEIHARSVLVGILDPTTRQHTATHYGSEYDNLKEVVLEFANNATSSYFDKDAMQIGQIGVQAEGQAGQGEHREEGNGWGHHYEGGLRALGGIGGGARQ